jgi:predicted lipoprotein with Yx(FWY)xxD motif
MRSCGAIDLHPTLQDLFAMKNSLSTLANIVALTTLTVALLAAASAFAQTTEAGGLLRDKAGKTLYTFDKDAANESRCFDGCAVAWPPFMAAEGAQAKDKLTLMPRKGGGMQWAFDGKPLYYFAGDTKPGDAGGDGSGGVWHVVKTGAGSKPAAATSGYSTTTY